MRVTGIITEYNPFHYGHLFQLEEARKLTNCDVLLVLMGGNIVQRGEFSLVDKWQRARTALHYGADVVVELPLLASLQSADYFAQVGVDLLSRLGCQAFVFGTEEASTDQLESFNDWEIANSQEIDSLVQVELSKGHSYAASYAKAVSALFEELAFDPSSPNHILALQYLKANSKLTQPMQPYAIKRVKSYQGTQVKSGSQIRQDYWSGSLEKDSLPEFMYQTLMDSPTISMEDYYPLLRYQLTCHSPESLAKVYGVREGLENRMLKTVDHHNKWSTYVQSLVSKRWTRSSIQRILLATLANISELEWQNYKQTYQNRPLARLLAFSPKGQEYLKSQRKSDQVELFSNYSQKIHHDYMLTTRFDRIFQLNPAKKIPDQYLKRYPMKK